MWLSTDHHPMSFHYYLTPLVATTSLYLGYQLAKKVYEEFTSPLRHLPGPSVPANLLLGHFRKLQNDSTITIKWREEFGANYQFRGLLNERELFTTDTKALSHVLTNDHIYQKGPVAQKVVRHFLGNGLLAVEMDEHKQQRKITNPAFGLPQIKELTEIFNQKSAQLRDIWSKKINSGDPEGSRIDVLRWLRKMTLDVIGLAGFHYEFKALVETGDEPNELDEALTRIFNSPEARRQGMLRVIQAAIPVLGILPEPGGKFIRDARTTMMDIAKKLLEDSKNAVKASGDETPSARRDLLSLMVKSNMSKDIPEHLRLSDADVIAQIPTFFVAGHETTSTATALALYALSIHPSVQSKLREELLSLGTDNPTMDELNSLPYLESVIRETMRLYPPVAFTVRTAMEDDVIPLSKPYLDRNGRSYDSISVHKGTAIRIDIAAVHLDKDLWGDDAEDFRPSRWEHIPDAASRIPSVWANLLNFLAGPHNCIGFRFSLVEMKSLLFILLRAFEFEMAVPRGDVAFSATPVNRPRVLSEPMGGSQLPLIVRPYLDT
ncbi:cytochrome P450 [Mycena alexandri]|uniref:Cytochrome P450 n=1 Tax=Mycena alexandri TaxID=1745969 RepID=A0AAD6WL90_9AGAR|nr:cytochrome P450 [Mycena alexandri]